MTKKQKPVQKVELKRGDKVRTCYGNIETVASADEFHVATRESIPHLEWYHPSKVTLITEIVPDQKFVDHGKCPVCGSPLDLDGICINIDCEEYSK